MGGELFLLESTGCFCLVVLRNYILQTNALFTGIFCEAQAHSLRCSLLFGSGWIRPGSSQLINTPSLLISLVSARRTPLSVSTTTGHLALILVGVRRSATMAASNSVRYSFESRHDRVQRLCQDILIIYDLRLQIAD